MSGAVTVEFIDVGRGKECWTETLRELTDVALVRAIKGRRGALGSRDVDIDEDEDGGHGGIYVGGFRRVGSWRLVQDADPTVPGSDSDGPP